MAHRIPLSFPVFEGNEKNYTEKAIASGNLATYGSFINKFENRLSKKIKSHQAVALNSGTSALHLAMVLLGIGPGDEVICQSFTFCASANPIVYLGAKPVFVDSENDTWNISPEILEDAILSRIAAGTKPKAIILVHLFGMPAKINELLEVANRFQIPVLEDAAEAVGSVYEGNACGTFGTIGVYSFNGNKIITSGGGGAIISNDTSIIQKANHLSTQARENLPYYHHLEIGFNYKMNNLTAAIGLAQLEQLDEFVNKRRKINSIYRELFSKFPGISFQKENEESNSNCWLTTILIDEKETGVSNEKIRMILLEKGIETRFLWKPLHLQPIFKDLPFYGGKFAEKMFRRGLCLPSSSNLTFVQQEEIFELIEREISKIYK
jgi:dTDP-4-amino-4,6-dideoxygalactose transaminase